MISVRNYIEFGTVVQEEISIFSFAGHFVQSRGKVCEILKISLSLPVLFLMTFPRWNFIFVFALTYCRACGHLMGNGGSLGSPMCDVFLSFITFPFSVLGQVWYLIVLIPDFCLLPNFGRGHYWEHFCVIFFQFHWNYFELSYF